MIIEHFQNKPPKGRIVIDIDGTIAYNQERFDAIEKLSGKAHTLHDEKQARLVMTDKSVLADAVTEFGAQVLAWLDQGVQPRNVYFLTARPYWLHDATREWLSAQGFRGSLICRGRSDGELTTEQYKTRELAMLQPAYVFDDLESVGDIAVAFGARFYLISGD